MTGVDITKKLESFSNLIQEFGNGTFSSKEIWNRKKEIDENFKAAQFEIPEQKTDAINKFNILIAQIEQKEKDVESANAVFSEEGEKLVETFESNAKKILSQENISKDDFKELRALSNDVFEYFKQQRWITKERRTTAWDKYSDIRNIVKDKEDELFAKEREDKAKQLSQSLEITEKLCVVVDACHPDTPIEDLLNFVIRFNYFLKENNLAENNKPWHLIEKPEDVKYSLRCRTETLNDVRNFITNYRDALTREHKGQVFANIDTLKEDLNKAWDTHKEERQKQQEEWEIKKKERDEKRIEWNKKQQEFLLFLEKRLENQIGYKAKQESYLQSQQEFAKRFESRIPQQQEYIKKLVEQVIDLEKKYATAWTDSFKTKVEEWIKEKKDKIASVEADIEVLKEKVVDINKKADELPARIKELDESIIEIKSKIEEVKEKLKNDVLIVENTVVEEVENQSAE
jgi:hypothetical protein